MENSKAGNRKQCLAKAKQADDKKCRDSYKPNVSRYILMEAMFNNLPYCLFCKDSEGVYLCCNEKYAQDLEAGVLEIEGKTDFDIYPRELAEKYRLDDRLVVETGRTIEIEEDYICHGKHRDVRTTKTPLRDKHGNIIGVLGFFSDITEQRRVERENNAVRQRLEYVLGATKTGLDIIDAGFNVVYIDPEWAKIYGDPAGRKCYEYFMNRSEICLGCGVRKADETKKPVVTEESFPKEGNRCVQVTTIPFQDASGEWFFAEVNVDITERKNREQQLAHVDKLATLGTLTASVAHEINNPVHFIMLNTPVIEQFCRFAMPLLEERYKRDGEFLIGKMPFSKIREKLPRLLDGMLEGARRIQNTVDDLKNFSQSGASGENVSVDVATSVETALSLIENQVLNTTAGCKITRSSGALPLVPGNSRRLEQVFVNIIQNACFATMDKSKPIAVNIGISRDSREVVVKITDQGVGMDSATLKRLYEPFFTTRHEQGGTGLGLPVAWRIVREHRGKMGFKSKPGHGTTVTVRLPVVCWE